ncbi:MAG TPA: bifunctional DNA-formamidopyrimidine glycosylase/DNA-(apurinic or apyrimidinic site) lyase [Candidatus Magasanikbacteria bacterium]|nr:bifunctional DNA-formamidopyrimidine glycosylase/DNA-(apurinic or apyrimidinic site) lyase [Candidatus Magasanikbacteria bacterium]
MPELPEVETIKRQLDKLTAGKKIVSAEFFGPQKMINLPKNKFLKILTGTKIVGVNRRAKLLILELNNDYFLLTHLKMTGKYLWNMPKDKHTHLVLKLNGKNQLNFKDVRKFGYLKLVKKEEMLEILENTYGPEPLDRGFTFSQFEKMLSQKPKSKIKQLLLDQKFIAGIGNIYAGEACFYANILPDRKVATLKRQEIQKLFQGLKSILTMAVKCGGTTADDYLDCYGEKGNYANKLKVYGRKGLPCYKCKTILKESRLGGRGTVFCPKCQK